MHLGGPQVGTVGDFRLWVDLGRLQPAFTRGQSVVMERTSENFLYDRKVETLPPNTRLIREVWGTPPMIPVE